jgi:hypothetical protein
MKKSLFLVLFILLSCNLFSQSLEVTSDDLSFRGNKMFPMIVYNPIDATKYYYYPVEVYGIYGAELIADAALHSGNYYLFFAMESTVIDSMAAIDVAGDTTQYKAITFPASTNFYAWNIIYIELTSGSGLAYKRE